MGLFNKKEEPKETTKEEKKELTPEEIENQVRSMSLSQLDKEDNVKTRNIETWHWIVSGAVFFVLFYFFERIAAATLQSGPYKIMIPKGIGMFLYMLTHSPVKFFVFLFLALGIAAILLMKLSEPKEREEDRMKISKVGVLGSINWMDNKEINDRFNLCPTDNLDGIPIGVRDGKAICIPWEPKSLNTSLPNNNILVTGPAGTRKSRGLIIPHCMQYIRRGTSLIVTDTKGDLYRKLAPIAKAYGYEIKKFICQAERFKYSDGWDCMKTVRESTDPLSAASMFADVVISNTEDPGAREPTFWRNLDGNLLEALALYVALSPQWVPITVRENPKRDLREVYALLSTSFENVEQIFENVKIVNNKDLCIAAYERWHNNAQAVQGFSNLATRLRVFQNKYIAGMLSADDIQITDAGKKKSIYFIIMDDQVSTYSFISSLFFSFAFYELVKEADDADQVLDVPVQFMLDEFANCGTIPDFTRKISTVRSRGIGITICLQGLNQLKLLYPHDEWENILNNCAVQIVLGAYENSTAEYYSRMIGDCTVEAQNEARDFSTVSISRMLGISKDVKVTKSLVKRRLLNPEEIRGMEIDRQIVLVAGTTKVLEEHKYDLSMHPDSKITANIKHTEGTPQWVIDEGLSENDTSVPEVFHETHEIKRPEHKTGIASIIDTANYEKEEESVDISGLNDYIEEEDDTNEKLNDAYQLDELTDDFSEELDDEFF